MNDDRWATARLASECSHMIRCSFVWFLLNWSFSFLKFFYSFFIFSDILIPGCAYKQQNLTQNHERWITVIFFDILKKVKYSWEIFQQESILKNIIGNVLICIVRHFQIMTFKNVFCYFPLFCKDQSRSSAANRTEPNMWVLKCPLIPDWDLWKLRDPKEPTERKKNWNKLNIVQCIYTIDRKIQKDWLSNLIVFAG